ncbi:MAG: class I SAM-dependent RNA methyltransferase [Treponema sp.]|jgi:putative N6-adenine-specific DNA methylase|nr:class I SAM-dependent RNA methyltransferase [Treponema sp.]
MAYNVAALCAVGAEKAVSNEIRKLGLEITESGFGRIRFKADLAGLYLALMGLRAADRVLLETAFFPATDFDDLFDGTQSVPWEDYIPRGSALVIAKVRTNRSILKAETSIQAVVHKAAAARLCQKWGIRRLPDEGDKAEIRVYIEKDKVSLLLDLSGEPLFKRGFRSQGGPAPLRETTAAALILLSGWKRKFPLYDPFCGSGTIALEALMYAWDMAPGLSRRFAVERLLLADRKTEKQIRDELFSRIDLTRQIRIAGSDADKQSVTLAASNMEKIIASIRGRAPESGMTDQPLFNKPLFKTLPMKEARPQQTPVLDADNPGASEGFIITNPPYGRRLGSPELSEEIYRAMGGLAQRFAGWKLVLITDHPGFESFFGKKANSCREITNGAIQSYMYQYERLA